MRDPEPSLRGSRQPHPASAHRRLNHSRIAVGVARVSRSPSSATGYVVGRQSAARRGGAPGAFESARLVLRPTQEQSLLAPDDLAAHAARYRSSSLGRSVRSRWLVWLDSSRKANVWRPPVSRESASRARARGLASTATPVRTQTSLIRGAAMSSPARRSRASGRFSAGRLLRGGGTEKRATETTVTVGASACAQGVRRRAAARRRAIRGGLSASG